MIGRHDLKVAAIALCLIGLKYEAMNFYFMLISDRHLYKQDLHVTANTANRHLKIPGLGVRVSYPYP